MISENQKAKKRKWEKNRSNQLRAKVKMNFLLQK